MPLVTTTWPAPTLPPPRDRRWTRRRRPGSVVRGPVGRGRLDDVSRRRKKTGTVNAGSANAGSANPGSANAGSANAGSANAGSAKASTASSGRTIRSPRAAGARLRASAQLRSNARVRRTVVIATSTVSDSRIAIAAKATAGSTGSTLCNTLTDHSP
ncbi:pentapeptide repeat-containing protein [Pseudonocardia dioxanivorans]|uniref:pentapeptide repeat-containing protein n=1 Tax=Pseudonocardia dioxanivorans TaxID=240495 RepID=UPI000A0724D5